MNTPSPSRWSDLFDIATSIIEQANEVTLIIDRWTLGGGTALMLQIDHRESHDIDLFVDDPQLMPFLNPETQDFALDLHPSSYASDGTQSLKIVFDEVGEIDVICCGWLTDGYAITTEVNGHQILLENPSEIIAKKVFHRGWNLQPVICSTLQRFRKSSTTTMSSMLFQLFPRKWGLQKMLPNR